MKEDYPELNIKCVWCQKMISIYQDPKCMRVVDYLGVDTFFHSHCWRQFKLAENKTYYEDQPN